MNALSLLPKTLQAGLVLLLLFSLSTSISCKKSDDNNPTATTYDKLKGKWTVLSINEKKYENNALVKEENQHLPSGAYTIEFKEKEVTFVIPNGTFTHPIDYNKDLNEFEYDDSGLKIKSSVTFNGDKATFIATEEHTDDGVVKKEVITTLLQKI
ncbi:hypothetical protein D3C72_737820 [compost metagenome]